MGVHGLWKLLEPTGRPVSLESLEGKVLAVDVSIWLNQAMYGMQGVQGTRRANAHLLVLFNRICKLLYYKIKPIFVFDGVAPELKKHTLHARRKRKELAVARAQRAADRIVKNYLKSHALHAVSGSSRRGKKANLSRMLPKAEREASIFELPPLPEDAKKKTRTILDEKEDMYLERVDLQESVQSQYEDLNDIDINSEDFRSLSEEIQHEVITNIRESRRKPFWSRFRELPKKADDFSDYQLSRLLKKGKMTHRLDELQRDMKTKTSGDLAVLLDYETRLEAFEAGRVASEDTQHYVLIRNQTKDDVGSSKAGSNDNEVPGSDDMIESKESRIDGAAINLVDEWFVPPSVENVERDSESRNYEQSSAGLVDEKSANSTEEKKKKEEIKHEVWKFFRRYNSQSKGEKVVVESGDGVKESERQRRETRSIFIDEEELRDREKRKASELWEKDEILKKRKLEDKELHREVTSTGKSKVELEVTSKSERELRPRSGKVGEVGGFFGESEINLSDEYDSDEEQKENNASCQKKIEVKDTDKNVKSAVCLEVDKSSVLEKMGKQVENVSLEEIPEESGAGLKTSKSEGGDKSVSKMEEDEVEEVTLMNQNAEVIDLSSKDDEDVVNLTKDEERMTEAGESKEVEKEEILMENGDNEEGMEVIILERDREGRELERKEEESKVGDVQESEDMKTAESTIEVELIPPTTPSHDELFPASLFQESTESKITEETNWTEDTTIGQPSSSQSAEANIPAGLDEEEFESMRASLDSERYDLEIQRGKDQRMAASVTEAMYNDSKELLNLFGIPYIESPQEAEAQCAFLDLSGQCEGVITDDSDVWLFGGQKVYKNFFTKDKEVLFYSNQAIERQLTLDRFKLISLGLLMGSDYTIGIQGVGFVTALEILSEFPGDGIECLVKFRKWWENVHNSDPPATESRVRSKLRKLALHPDFPSQVVIKAYLDPDVDKSKEKFTWNSPDLDLLRKFAQEKLGWIRSKTDELLLPVLKRLKEKIVQGKISSYFFLQHDVDKERRKFKSKRVQEVLQKLSNPDGEGDVDEENSEPEEREMRDDRKRKKSETDEDEDGPYKKKKNQEDGKLKGKHRKGKQRKQSKGKIQKMQGGSGDVEMEAVNEISDEDGSSSDVDQVAVARIARGFESDRGRHAWLGRDKRRKLFTKNNRGIGRSWKKHNWDDEAENIEENEVRMLGEEGEEEEEKERSENVERNSEIDQSLHSNSQDVEEEREKSDSYWENQISDTEYDIDELIAAGTANVAGKMIGGSRAGVIMKSLERRYDEDKNHEGDGSDEDESSSASSKRTKGGVVGRETEKGGVKGKVQNKNGSDASRKGKEGGSRQQNRDTKRNQMSDSDEEEKSSESRREMRGRGVGQRRNQTGGNLKKKEYEEEYRIEDEKEPEKDEEESRMQAKRRAERNPYLRRQVPSKGTGLGSSGIVSQQFKKSVSRLAQHERNESEMEGKGEMGKKAMNRKKKEEKKENARRPDEAGLEEYRIEEEVEPKKDAAEERVQMTRKVQRNPFLTGNKGGTVRMPKVAPSTAKSGKESKVKNPTDQASNNARSLRTRRNVNYFQGNANEIVGIPDLRKDSDYDSGVDEELDKDSGVDDGEDFVPRKLQLPPRQRVGASGRGRGGRGGSKGVKGKGKQLLKKRTRFKSTAPSFSGPKLSESSSSDED